MITRRWYRAAGGPAPRRSCSRPLGVAVVLAVATLTACGDDGGGAGVTGAAGPGVDNCGVDVALDGPPERIVAVFHNAIEMAHALGVGDRLVGTAFLDNAVLPEYAEAQEATEYYESIPNREELLRLDPGFVMAGFTTFTDEDMGTRGELADLGIGTWISPSMCPSEDGGDQGTVSVDDVGIEMIYDEVTQLGDLLGEPEAATELRDRMQATVDDVTAAVGDIDERPRVAIIGQLSDRGQYQTFGSGDIADEIIRLAGGENAYADLQGRLGRTDVEDLITRVPDAIVVVTCCSPDLDGDDAGADIAALRDDPAMANVPAVRDDRFLGATFAEISPGVRVPMAVENLARFLHPGAFGG